MKLPSSARATRPFSRITTLRGHTFLGPLSKDSTVVDLGGNLGEFSQQVSQEFGCCCFVAEPVPALFARIPESERLRKFNLAIGGRNGTQRFHTADNIEAGSLQARAALDGEGFEVETVTLEEFLSRNQISRVDLLKVDIEGAERELFARVERRTLRAIAQISIEFHDFVPDIMSHADVRRIRLRLRRAGFRCIPWKITSNMDVLFVRESLLPFWRYLLIKHGLRYADKILQRLPNRAS